MAIPVTVSRASCEEAKGRAGKTTLVGRGVIPNGSSSGGWAFNLKPKKVL